MPDITKIRVGNGPENSYRNFQANREFKKRAEDDNPGGGWPADLPKPSVGGYGYTEQGEQVLFDGDLLIDQQSQSPTGAVYNIIDIDQLEVGETYKIVWNGVDYTCECMSVDLGGGDELAYLGNLSIVGFPISTDYPFLFVYQEDGYMVATLTTGTYSIKLSKSGETIHKIDEKYLPASGVGAMVVTVEHDDDGVLHANKTFAEIKSAIKSGLDVNCSVDQRFIARLSGYYFDE